MAKNSLIALTLVLSVILHGTIVLSLVQKNQKAEPQYVARPLGLQDLLVELKTDVTKSTTSSRSARKKTLSPLPENITSGGFHRHTVLNALPTEESSRGTTHPPVNAATGSEDSAHDDLAPDPMKSQAPGGHSWSAGVQYGNEMNLKFTLESYSFFYALHGRINTELVYPDDFSRQKITGRVRIEAEINRDGRLLKFRTSTADDRLLQTYCFAMLLRTLDRPLNETSWLQTEAAIVTFDFDFRVRLPQEPASEFESGIQKNRLSFGRQNEIDPWLNEKIHEIFTHYIPPIVPLPGGFYVDLVLAYQYVNNLIEGTPPESQQRRDRIQKLHENLKTAIRRTRDKTGT